jgi:hypothetical protein
LINCKNKIKPFWEMKSHTKKISFVSFMRKLIDQRLGTQNDSETRKRKIQR